MTPLAPHLTAFLQERLPIDRRASAHTIESYAYAFQLLLTFVAQRLSKSPSSLSVEHLDGPTVLAFLRHLEAERGNTARTRNARLAAIKSFARFLEYRVPRAMEQLRQLLAIPIKKCDERLVAYLTADEVQCLLNAPDPKTRLGIRDRAMLHLAFACGLRVSELVGVRINDLKSNARMVVHVEGKGRRERSLPLWKETATAIRSWLGVRGPAGCDAVFLNARGQPMSRSGFEYVLAKYVPTAKKAQASMKSKRVSPHVLRHSCAMHTLQATNDIRKVSLWLGHASVQSTEVYLRADPTEKLDALDAATPPTLRRGRFRAPDKLIAALRAPIR